MHLQQILNIKFNDNNSYTVRTFNIVQSLLERFRCFHMACGTSSRWQNTLPPPVTPIGASRNWTQSSLGESWPSKLLSFCYVLHKYKKIYITVRAERNNHSKLQQLKYISCYQRFSNLDKSSCILNILTAYAHHIILTNCAAFWIYSQLMHII